jgi:hypothetical protein
MKIKYTIKEVKKNVFAVVVPDSYDRCMLFLRVQEYYENPKYKGKNFDIWEFVKYYSRNNIFRYAEEWDGFNFPYRVAEECYNNIIQYDTPYDALMDKILGEINPKGEAYIIGVDSATGETYDHELCHAEYYLNKEYKKEADRLIKSLPKELYATLKKNLLRAGYHRLVINDEIQAYMLTNYFSVEFCGLQNLHEYHLLFKQSL